MTGFYRHLVCFSLVVTLLLSGCADITTISSTPGTGTSQAHGKPENSAVDGCSAQADGGDQQLTVLKNRTDIAAWAPISFSEMLRWTWPQSVEKKNMASWSQADAKAVAQHNGRPVSITGYVALAKSGGQGSVNCHTQGDNTFYIWLVSSPTRDRSHSIITAITPRVRAQHPGWTDNFYRITRRGLQVRMSGWTLLNSWYPEQLHQTQGTLWEILPIMQVEVQQNGKWVPLDLAQL